MNAPTDTICAIATPPGMGGVGIVRVSGPEAFAIAALLFQGTHPLEKVRALRFGAFRDPATGEVLDEGFLLAMPAPKSYTAEDVVEFHAHGSPSLLSRLIEALTVQGAKIACPGEFTYRAFMNGRLDLVQAEAVQVLVASQGDAARREALRQLTGGLASHLEPIETSLQDLLVKVEARLEFPEEGIPEIDREAFGTQLAETGESLLDLVESYRKGRVLSDGLKVAIVGPPNAGKSSLLNTLLGRERAIVTPHPGTTRDVVEGETLVGGAKVRFYDTAGLRAAAQEIEIEGIRRSRQVIVEADVVLWMVDASDPGPGIQESYAALLPEDRTWYLFNKVDLLHDPEAWKKEMGLLSDGRCIPVSCKTGLGMDLVAEVVEAAVGRALSGEDVALLSARHKAEAEEAVRCIAKAGQHMQEGRSLELWAEELKAAARAVGRIRGRNLPETAFQEIFERFCIGK